MMSQMRSRSLQTCQRRRTWRPPRRPAVMQICRHRWRPLASRMRRGSRALRHPNPAARHRLRRPGGIVRSQPLAPRVRCILATSPRPHALPQPRLWKRPPRMQRPWLECPCFPTTRRRCCLRAPLQHHPTGSVQHRLWRLGCRIAGFAPRCLRSHRRSSLEELYHPPPPPQQSSMLVPLRGKTSRHSLTKLVTFTIQAKLHLLARGRTTAPSLR